MKEINEKEGWRKILIGSVVRCTNPECRLGTVKGAPSNFDPCTGEMSGPPILLDCGVCRGIGFIEVTESNYDYVWKDAARQVALKAYQKLTPDQQLILRRFDNGY